MSSKTWLPESLQPLERSIDKLFRAACLPFPATPLAGRAVQRPDTIASECRQLRKWLTTVGRLLGGRSRSAQLAVSASDGINAPGGFDAVEALLTRDDTAPSGLLGAWPTKLLAEVPSHLLPDRDSAGWVGLYPPGHCLNREVNKVADKLLEELSQKEFENAWLLPHAQDVEAHPNLLSRALQFRLCALRLVQWARVQLADFRDAICPRVHLGERVSSQHFRVRISLAGFTRPHKLPATQAKLLSELILNKEAGVAVTKQKVHDLKKSLPELAGLIEEKSISQYALPPEVCSRAKLASCWHPARQAKSVPGKA